MQLERGTHVARKPMENEVAGFHFPSTLSFSPALATEPLPSTPRHSPSSSSMPGTFTRSASASPTPPPPPEGPSNDEVIHGDYVGHSTVVDGVAHGGTPIIWDQTSCVCHSCGPLQDLQAGEAVGDDPRFRDASAILAMFGGTNPNLRRNPPPKPRGGGAGMSLCSGSQSCLPAPQTQSSPRAGSCASRGCLSTPTAAPSSPLMLPCPASSRPSGVPCTCGARREANSVWLS